MVVVVEEASRSGITAEIMATTQLVTNGGNLSNKNVSAVQSGNLTSSGNLISIGNLASTGSPAKPARQLSDPNHNCLQDLKDALLPRVNKNGELDSNRTTVDEDKPKMENGDLEKSIGNINFTARNFEGLFEDEAFLINLFKFFPTSEKSLLTTVCKQWRTILNHQRYWKGVTPILHKRDLYEEREDGNKEFTSLLTFELREFESVCLVSVSDMDICEFIDHCPKTKKTLKGIALRRSTVTDAGLEVMLEQLGAVTSLELSGCNDFTEAGLWASLHPRLLALSISDCINVADESVAAIAQRLPNLKELNFQAYHVTDGVLGCLVALRGGSLTSLRLKSCWELTNQAVVNLVHCLPQLTTLSLSGCSKITDEGVEMIAANMSALRSLDLSWCPRITDASLEYIACDLAKLEELILDRCVRITDTGVGFLATLGNLRALYLRWCCQVQDFGLQNLYQVGSLRILSVAGCPLLTADGLSGLAQVTHLEELELTNCPGASEKLMSYLKKNLPNCTVIY